jgi:hypothetical protein
MIAPSFNFDIGVKNYKKNRLIVDKIHLKNEILYTIEKTSKNVFNISSFSFFDEDVNNVKSFDEVRRQLVVSSLSNSFNFFINREGNILTDVEMNSVSYFYPDASEEINVVFCFYSKTKNLTNDGEPLKFYNFNQLKNFKECLSVFKNTAYEVKYKKLSVDNRLDRITNLGFDIENYVKERSLD